MKARLLITLLLFYCANCMAQEITINSCTERTTDLSASTNLRLDENKVPCALVKVQIVAKDVRFNGVIVGEIENKTNEYWVYMRQGTERLNIQMPGVQPLNIVFEDYGIDSLAAKTTYELNLTAPETVEEEMTDSTQYLLFRVTPTDATVVIDGDTLALENGSIQKIMKVGVHNYRVTRKNYCTESGVLAVEKGETRVKNLSLMALRQTIKCFGVSIEMIPVNVDPVDDAEAEESNLPTHSYLLSETEVTQQLWKYVMSGMPGMKLGDNPSINKGDKKPVDNVSYEDCIKFINKLNEIYNYKFRLPTEAEWQYAALGGNQSQGYVYCGADNIDDIGWYKGNSQDKSHAVKTKLPNEIGLYDMSGNVEEWCISDEGPITKGGSFMSEENECVWKSQGTSKKSKTTGFRLAM